MPNRQIDIQDRQAGSSKNPGAPTLDTMALNKLAAKAGTEHKLHGNPARSILEGHFQIARATSGILLHTSDNVELTDSVSSIKLPAGLSITVLLQGKLRFSVAEQALSIKANDNLDSPCFAINLTQPALLKRQIQQGNTVQKVNVSVRHDWLEAQLGSSFQHNSGIHHFLSRSLEIFQWPASTELQLLAKQLIEPGPYKGALLDIYKEGKAFEIIALALHAITKNYRHSSNHLTNFTHVSANNRALARKVHKYLEDYAMNSENSGSTELRLEQLASHIGMSISTLQRIFKQSYGQTVFEYLRQRKLEMAREALEKKKVSIGEAAYIAGYRHSSNFAIAFKKLFGISPGSLY